MLKVQKFLQIRPLEELEDEPFNLNITIKDALVLLKYNQFNSDFSNEIVKECRGLILEKDTWKVVCHPFHKFFNVGESNAYQGINLAESISFEKIDGSIIKIYFYNDEWLIATNGTIDARDATNMDGISFRDLFFDVISSDEFEDLTNNFDRENTYLFEIIHPAIQIIVDYDNKKELVFIGMIKNESDTDEIVDYDILGIRKKMEKIFGELGIRYPRVFDMSKITDITELGELADIENKEGNEFEGYVTVQMHNGVVVGRVKTKSPKYVQLHHVATGEGVTNNLLSVLVKNELDEFEVYLEKLPKNVADEYICLKRKYFDLIEYLCIEGKKYREFAGKMTRKELALNIQHSINICCRGYIFTMIDDITITPKQIITSIGIKKLKRLLIP